MKRSDTERLGDIAQACAAIARYLASEDDQREMMFDAIRARLIEIGEAVKDVDASILASEPGIPWTEIARMRDQLTHHYFDTAHSIVRMTATDDIPLLSAAVARLQHRALR